MPSSNRLLLIIFSLVLILFTIGFAGRWRAIQHSDLALPGELPTGDARAGMALATRYCAVCHDITGGANSPQPAAPPFGEVVTRWPVEYLAEALAEGISVNHQQTVQMPEFTFEPDQIDDLLAYLETLKK